MNRSLIRQSVKVLFQKLGSPAAAPGFGHLLGVFSVFLFIYMAFIAEPVRRGDAYEYLYMSRSIQNHLTPDLQQADADSLRKAMEHANIDATVPIYNGFSRAFSGAQYSYHFWLYSALNAPLMWLWEKLFADPIRSFHVTNTLLFLLALWVFYRFARLEREPKLLALAALALNPVLWYLCWWMPETFTYSLVLLSLAVFTRGQFALASTLAALGAAQNPPVLLLAIYFGLRGLIAALQHKKWRHILRLVPAGIIAGAPSLFYLVNFGVPNLIIKQGGTQTILLPIQRILDVFIDLNAGIMPYLPAAVLLFVPVLLIVILQRRWQMLAFPLLLLGMAWLAAQTANWNSDSAGMMRYALWMVPVLVFFVASIPPARWLRWVWLASLTLQLVVLGYFGGLSANISYVQFTPLARWVLNQAPALYAPEPESFIERAKGSEGSIGGLPAIYADANGVIKKMWIDHTLFSALVHLNNIALDIADVPQFNAVREQLRAQSGFQYVSFSKPVILFKPQQNVPTQRLKSQLTALSQPPQRARVSQVLSLQVAAANRGDFPWYTFRGERPLILAYRWRNPQGEVVPSLVRIARLPAIVSPGEEVIIPMTIWSPPSAGTYQLEIDLLWQEVAWFGELGNTPLRWQVEVVE